MNLCSMLQTYILYVVVPCQCSISITNSILQRITLLLQSFIKKKEKPSTYYSTTVRTICCVGRETQQQQQFQQKQQQTHEKRRRRFLFSPAAGLTANVAAMRTHQSLERFLPIQLTSKARISHTDRDTAVQQYTTAAFLQKLFKRKKSFIFHSELNKPPAERNS